uniref:WhiB family transcription factor n=1 Tax=Mycobacterium phage Pharb TaxID=3136626 RepID=A0AAU8GNW6_9VIRU
MSGEYMTLPEAWEADALCAQVDPELFFPAQGQPGAPAKAVCARCPVVDECLDRALSFPTEQWGVWGGLSQRERREVVRNRRKANAA